MGHEVFPQLAHHILEPLLAGYVPVNWRRSFTPRLAFTTSVSPTKPLASQTAETSPPGSHHRNLGVDLGLRERSRSCHLGCRPCSQLQIHPGRRVPLSSPLMPMLHVLQDRRQGSAAPLWKQWTASIPRTFSWHRMVKACTSERGSTAPVVWARHQRMDWDQGCFENRHEFHSLKCWSPADGMEVIHPFMIGRKRGQPGRKELSSFCQALGALPVCLKPKERS